MGRGPRKMAKAEAAAAAPAKQIAIEKDPVDEEDSDDPNCEDGDDAPVTDADKCVERLNAWVEDEKKMDRWITSRGGGLEEPLTDTNGGILRLQDFFPLDIADLVLAIIENLPEKVWEVSEQGKDYGAASHRFWSADLTDVPALAPLRTVFWKLLKKFKGEPTLPIFSIARYGSTDHIGRHDDRAHVPFFSDDNIYSRTVAVIWYLTKNWWEEEGGQFVDLADGQDGKKYLPRFNNLTLFEVPHWHAVEAVSSQRYRYSIFGWYHQQGKRYDVDGGSAADSGKKKKKKRLSNPGGCAEDAEAVAVPVKKKLKKKKPEL